MKSSKNIVWSFILLVIVAALYRIIPGRPFGFAPQWAMAVFAGAVIRDKKWAFIIPVLSMFIKIKCNSDNSGFFGRPHALFPGFEVSRLGQQWHNPGAGPTQNV